MDRNDSQDLPVHSESARYCLIVPLSLEVIEAAEGSWHSAQIHKAETENLSVKGLQLRSELPLQKNDKLKITVHFQSQDLEITAQVVRIRPAVETGGDINSIGVEFVDLSGELKTQLQDLITPKLRLRTKHN